MRLNKSSQQMEERKRDLMRFFDVVRISCHVGRCLLTTVTDALVNLGDFPDLPTEMADKEG